ncbi:MAG: tyrosine-type recombinase/integrase [Anaerolineae bacterium]|nr:tyrosine-type recombinase/integrase [Anaerolineae bacterium]
MLLSEAIEALAVATIADGRSLLTAKGYRSKLAHLVAFLGDMPVDQVTVTDLRRFVTDLRERDTRYVSTTARPSVVGGLSVATIAGRVRSFKRLFNWLHEEGIITSNPARRIKVPKVPRDEPKAYAVEDLQRLLTATAGDDPADLRNRAIILFLADTGCRVAGVAGLKLADLDMDRRIAKVTEKGSKSRKVPFSQPTAAALAAWLAVRPANTPYVWSGVARSSRDHLSAEGIRQMLKRVGRKAGVTGPVNPHSFRHGFAREYLSSGGDLATLADLLGHSDVQVTWNSYAIFRTSELQAKHDKHSPIARMGREGEL